MRDRETHLSNIHEAMKESYPYSLSEALVAYGEDEKDSGVFDQVVTQVLDVYQGQNERSKLDLLRFCVKEGRNEASILVFTKKFMDHLPNPFERRDLDLNDALLKIGAYAGMSAAIGNYLKEVWAPIEAKYDTERVLFIAYKFSHGASRPNLSVYRPNDISEFFADKVIDHAEKMDDKERLYYLGQVASDAMKDGPVQNRARHLLLEDITKSADITQVLNIIKATASNSYYYRPDNEIDAAGAERWQGLISKMSTEDQAEQTGSFLKDKNAKLGISKTLDVIVDTALQAIDKLGEEKGYSLDMRDTLDAIVKMNIVQSQDANKLLEKFPSEKQPAASKISLDDFLKNKPG